jgi:hypothetical protein
MKFRIYPLFSRAAEGRNGGCCSLVLGKAASMEKLTK